MSKGLLNIFEEGEVYQRLKCSSMTESAIAEMLGVELVRVTTLLSLSYLDEFARQRLIRDLPLMYVSSGGLIRAARSTTPLMM